MNDWISVKDRLPDKNYLCWVALNDGAVEEAWYFGAQEVFGKNEYHMFNRDVVTHWQTQEKIKPKPPNISMAKEVQG